MPTPASHRPRVLAIVLAGGAGSRLGPLTARGPSRPCPSPACSGSSTSPCRTSRTAASPTCGWSSSTNPTRSTTTWPTVARGTSTARSGGLLILPPFQRRSDAEGDGALASGNADALVQQRQSIEQFAPDVVFTLSADHLYRLDLRDVLATHLANDAQLTIVTTDPPGDDDPTRFAWVSVDGGTVTDFAYKPDEPSGDRICTEVFAFDGPVLIDRLARLGSDADDDPTAGPPATTATGWFPNWWPAAVSSSTSWRATGVTSAPSGPFTVPTWSWSLPSRPWPSTIPAGRSSPVRSAAARPAWRRPAG